MKGYTAVSAISEAFKILQTGVVDQQQREQIDAIKAQLTALEDGTPNVIDVWRPHTPQQKVLYLF